MILALLKTRESLLPIRTFHGSMKARFMARDPRQPDGHPPVRTFPDCSPPPHPHSTIAASRGQICIPTPRTSSPAAAAFSLPPDLATDWISGFSHGLITRGKRMISVRTKVLVLGRFKALWGVLRVMRVCLSDD
jgi:hypothetical protein